MITTQETFVEGQYSSFVLDLTKEPSPIKETKKFSFPNTVGNIPAIKEIPALYSKDFENTKGFARAREVLYFGFSNMKRSVNNKVNATANYICATAGKALSFFIRFKFTI